MPEFDKSPDPFIHQLLEGFGGNVLHLQTFQLLFGHKKMVRWCEISKINRMSGLM